jgi:hypothetical protein
LHNVVCEQESALALNALSLGVQILVLGAGERGAFPSFFIWELGADAAHTFS